MDDNEIITRLIETNEQISKRADIKFNIVSLILVFSIFLNGYLFLKTLNVPNEITVIKQGNELSDNNNIKNK